VLYSKYTVLVQFILRALSLNMVLQRIGQCANKLGNILLAWNFWRVRSLIFKYARNYKICGKTYRNKLFFIRLYNFVVETFFSLTNIWLQC